MDGFFRLDGGAMFGIVPRVLWEKRNPPDDKNRILMAPMTRDMAHDDLAPSKAMAKYYGRRSDAGLIITEGTNLGPYDTNLVPSK